MVLHRTCRMAHVPSRVRTRRMAGSGDASERKRDVRSDRGIVLSPGVVVTWEEVASHAAPEGAVTIQGRLVGFDDLFGEVRIDHARLVNGAD